MAIEDKDILDAIEQSDGTFKAIARAAGCHRKTVASRALKSQEIRDAIAERKEFVTDVAETMLIRSIRKGKAWAIKFWLMTQAKDRGYTYTKQDSTDSRSSRIVIVPSMSDADRVPPRDDGSSGIDIILPNNGRDGLGGATQ